MTIGGKYGHSAIEAYEEALALRDEGTAASAYMFPLPTGVWKLFVLDDAGRLVFYTEAPRLDLERILDAIGPNHDRTAMVNQLQSDGMTAGDALLATTLIERAPAELDAASADPG